MGRTDLDPTALAASLRRMAGDGSVEWVTEPMQTRVLLDVADMLDGNAKLRELVPELCEQNAALFRENAKLRELVKEMRVCLEDECKRCHEWGDACDLEHQMRELGIEVDG